MIKLNTIEGRTIYINPSLVGALEVSKDAVHILIGDRWLGVRESEDDVIMALYKKDNSYLKNNNSYERL